MQPRNCRTSQSRLGTLQVWTLLVPLLVLTALIAAPPQARLWAAVVSSASYSLMQYLLPECRFRTDPRGCPLNFAMALFLLKLVVVPALIMFGQPVQATLPSMPNRSSMEAVLLVETAAYVAFCLAIGFMPARPAASGVRAAIMSLLEAKPSLRIAGAFACIGAFGFFAAFRSIGNLIEYFVNPPVLQELNQQAEGSILVLTGTLLRPFLAFSLVLLWCRRADGQRAPGGKLREGFILLLVACGVFAANSTFSFNRAAFVFPLVALTAVFISRVPIPAFVLLTCAAVAMTPIVWISSYRAAKPADESVAFSTPAPSVTDQLQLYAGGPQFLGYFLDQTGWGRSPYWGSTLIASTMHAVPILGKGFRESSGVAIYNRAIYGDSGIEDQIIPLQGELFINFHLMGVVAGFFVLGLVMAEFQRRLETTSSAFAAFVIQYIALWAAMLIIWSLAVFCQILLYFCWPVYAYAGWSLLKRWAASEREKRAPQMSSRPLPAERIA
jgi:hypothetical protein